MVVSASVRIVVDSYGDTIRWSRTVNLPSVEGHNGVRVFIDTLELERHLFFHLEAITDQVSLRFRGFSSHSDTR